MEELKQLIRDDKELLRQVDADMLAFREAIIKLDNLSSHFLAFFERQAKFMELIESLLKDRK